MSPFPRTLLPHSWLDFVLDKKLSETEDANRINRLIDFFQVVHSNVINEIQNAKNVRSLSSS